MSTLPNHILKALKDNKTSLGEHPSFPPDEEEKFIVYLVQDTYDELCEKLNNVEYQDLKNKLGKLIVECRKIERNNKEALEQLCANVINEMFQIPQDTIDLDIKIVDKIDTSSDRLLPEKTLDFSFEDIEDMNNLTDEIYKRRMLNALVTGASIYYMNYIIKYVKEIFDIDSELPSLYKKILECNNILIYNEKDTLMENDKALEGGKVDVMISSNDTLPIIKAEGVLFPILFEETVKGLLELAISHGLPKNKEKAKYVLSKSDFKLAEMWDMRLGLPLWKLIDKQMKEAGYDIFEVGLNFFLMKLSEMDCKTFNKSLQEIFAKTKKGKEILSDISEEILYEKDKDEFDDYVQTKNDSTVQLNDDDCFTADELLDNDEENYFTSDELINDSYQIEETLKKKLTETEYNYHFSGKSTKDHDKRPYGSDTKNVMAGRETGHFGSGTYFSTYPSLYMDKKYANIKNPEFIKIDDKTYRVDFDLYKNLYRVKNKKQGDILYTLCYNLNRMYSRMTYFGDFNPKTANYNNSDLYQVIKANANALNLKCPSYYELTRMAQNHTGRQSFSTLFMEYNGYNGVNVSGVEYYDNTKHGSVIYDLSKTNSDMEEVNPKSLYTGFKDRPYNDTIAQESFIDKPEMEALKGEYITWYDELNKMPLNQALRVLKNYTMSGNVLNPYSMRNVSDDLKKRYLKMLYTAVAKDWPNNNRLFDNIIYDKRDIINLIEKTKSYYWVNCNINKESFLIDLLWNKSFDWDLSVEEENRQRKQYLDMLLQYLKRDLTSKEKDFIEKDYYNSDEE